MLHGFPGSEQNVDVQRALLDEGIASLRLHFQGAWGSGGFYRFSTLIDQAKAGLRRLSRRKEVDSRRLGVFGFSMGGWAALNLAGASKTVKAAAAVSPVGGPEMVLPSNDPFIRRHCEPLRVASPGGLVRDFRSAVRRFDPAAAVAKTKAPILLIHGTADELIPVAVSERLRAAAGPGRCRLVRAAGADHSYLDRRTWLARRVSRWLASTLRGARL
jgi:dipeptidyl aminopeptidase/acylaminoacyl peptidase